MYNSRYNSNVTFIIFKKILIYLFFLIDNLINIDFIKITDAVEIHEIKKTDKMELSHEFQLLYYMFYLKNEKDIKNIKGFLNYPNSKIKKDVLPKKRIIKENK